MTTQKKALIYGAGGFIGSHLAKRLKREGYWVRGVDLKYPEYMNTDEIFDHFVIRDLRIPVSVTETIGYAGCKRNPYQTYAQQFDIPFDEVYQLAADMGGAGYIFTGDNDANIMHNSATINLNLLDQLVTQQARLGKQYPKVFYSSSACIYPSHNQTDPHNPNCRESTAYPANPDSEYGWEKLFSERLYAAYSRNHDVPVRIARFHNIYGPHGTWKGGKEKAPAAICRKVADSEGSIEIWGDGNQTRSFLYIDDCIDAVRLMMNSNHQGPMNIGSEEMVTINRLVDIAIDISGKKNLVRKYVPGPVGVAGRNSHNGMIEACLGWKPQYTLVDGMIMTYKWIEKELNGE